MSVISTWVSPHAEITRQALRSGRRSVVAWAVSFVALVGVYAAFWPSIRGNTQWRQLFDTLPQSYRAMFSAGGQIDLSTPAGYLGIELLGLLGPALIAIYAIGLGTAAIAGEEADGRLEVTLSAPVARSAVLAERFAAMVGYVAAVMIVTGLSIWVYSLALDMRLGIGVIASAVAAMAIFGIFVGAVAMAAGAMTGSTALARGIAALIGVASYLINALAQVTSSLESARPASPFYLLFGNEPLAHGLRIGPALAVLAVSLVIMVGGGAWFARRDLS